MLQLFMNLDLQKPKTRWMSFKSCISYLCQKITMNTGKIRIIRKIKLKIYGSLKALSSFKIQPSFIKC